MLLLAIQVTGINVKVIIFSVIPFVHDFCYFLSIAKLIIFMWPLLYIHSVKSTTKTLFSVTVFMYDFLQKNNTFVKYCYPSIYMVCQNVI